MKSRDILRNSWQITLKNKYLWIFGFVAAVAVSGGTININRLEGGSWFLRNIVIQDFKDATILLGGITFIVWILGLIARISLIQSIAGGVQSQNLISRVTELFKSSTKFLGSLILMQLLVWSPIIILNFLFGIWLQPMAESVETTGFFPDFTAFQTFWKIGVGLFLLSIPFLLLDGFSYRSIIIENLGVIAGIKRAYYVIRINIRSVLTLSIICVLLGLVFATAASFIAGIVLMPLSMAMIPMVQQSIAECTGNSSDFETSRKCAELVYSQPMMVWTGMLLGIITAAIYSIWVTFQSSAFTLAYVKLTKRR